MISTQWQPEQIWVDASETIIDSTSSHEELKEMGGPSRGPWINNHQILHPWGEPSAVGNAVKTNKQTKKNEKQPHWDLVIILNVGKNGQRASRNKDVCEKRRGGEAMEQKMKAFVALMLNELENTIELLRLWKSLWGHRKLAPVWERACWQKGALCGDVFSTDLHAREVASPALPPLVSETYFFDFVSFCWFVFAVLTF